VSVREALLAGGPFVLIAVALLVLAYRVLQPNPPRHAALVTGSEQSALDAFGEQYRAALAERGIVLELRRTGGTVANLQALRDPAAEVSFGSVQGSTAADTETPPDGLESLGSPFYEPVWILHRRAGARGRPVRLADMGGWRVNVAAPESGVPQLFERLLELNRIDPAHLERTGLPDTEAVIALIEQ